MQSHPSTCYETIIQQVLSNKQYITEKAQAVAGSGCFFLACKQHLAQKHGKSLCRFFWLESEIVAPKGRRTECKQKRWEGYTREKTKEDQ